MDLTGKLAKLNGVNADTNFTHSDAVRLDFVALGITAASAHQLFTIPAGRAITKVTAVVLAAVTGGDVAVKMKVGSTETTLVTLDDADLVLNAVMQTNVNDIAAYSPSDVITIEVTPAATITAGDIVLIIDSVPVKEFITNG